MMVGIMTGIVILFVATMYLYAGARVTQKEHMEREKYAVAMLEEQKQSYQGLLRQQEEVRMMEHDMKNRLLGMRSYFVSGEIGKGLEKIDELLETYGAYTEAQVREGQPWQAVVEAKLAYAREQGIAVESRVGEGDYDKVDDIDFCILLGNLLDNAVEAQTEETDRWISFLVAEDKGTVYVRLENSVPEGSGYPAVGDG